MTPAQRDRWLSGRPGAKAIYDYLKEHGESTPQEIAEACPGMSMSERRSAIMTMRQWGIVEKVPYQAADRIKWRVSR